MRRSGFILPILLLAACGDSTGPSTDSQFMGTYVVTTLTFDPQGILPAVDVLARLEGDVPRLVLARDGQSQLVFEDPVTGLITTANGTYSTTSDGARLDFGSDTAFRTVLLSRRMTFSGDGSTAITFDAPAPDGVERARLLQLVPEFADEQLLDPVPGQLTVVFTRSP